MKTITSVLAACTPPPPPPGSLCDAPACAADSDSIPGFRDNVENGSYSNLGQKQEMQISKPDAPPIINLPPSFFFVGIICFFFCRIFLLAIAFHSLDKMDRATGRMSASRLQVRRPRYCRVHSRRLRDRATGPSNLCRFQTRYPQHTHPRYCLFLQLPLISHLDNPRSFSLCL